MAMFLRATGHANAGWCVMLALCVWLHHAQGKPGHLLGGNQNPTVRENVQVHLLCEQSADLLQLLRSNSRHLHVLFWCGDWNRYLEVLERDCYHHTHVVAVVSTIAFRVILPTTAKQIEGVCSNVKWVLVNGTDGPSSTNLRPSGATFMRDAISSLAQAAPSSDIAAIYKQMLANGAVPWRTLAGQAVSVGCITIKKAAVGENCFSFKENTLVQALHAINGAYNITAIKRGKFATALRRKQVDIVANRVGITRARYRHFAFTVNKFGHAVYYVKKNWKRDADLFFFGMLPWMLLLALFMVLSAGSIVFLNLRRGNRPTTGLGDVVLALTATTLAFSSPLPSQHARNTLSRLIMASWMLACLSLVIYTRSLLTASLMAGPSWEADDSLDEILPKLQRGLLLPCTETNSFFDFALTRATGNGSGVVDAMALAAKRRARRRRDFTGTFQSCVQRTRKGTHVFFTDDMDPCMFSRLDRFMVKGEKPVYSLVGGFPVRRDYLRRAELISVVQRIFETGWEIRFQRLAQRNCSEFVENHQTSLRATTFMYIYCLCCTLSFVAFCLEYVFSRLFSSPKSRWPVDSNCLNVRPSHPAWARGSLKRHRSARRSNLHELERIQGKAKSLPTEITLSMPGNTW